MKYKIKDYPQLKKRIASMTIEELLKTVICPYAEQGKPVPRGTSAVFVHPTTTDNARKTADMINENREDRALIASDMEYGPGNAIVGAVEFPSMRAAAQAGDVELAYQMGVCAAKEAINAGYHWTFGPCVDIIGNINNPIVTNRSVGENVDAIIKYSGAYVDGLQENGLIATLKHFPGDGYSSDDQHVTTSVNPLPCEEWDNTFGKVYRDLIERGVMAIMPGHIALPAYDEPDENGLYPPATVSQNMLTGLLKEKLGFEGLIVSDAVNMGGFCGYMNLYRASCAFLEAGGDCLLFMFDNEEYLVEMKRCMEKGYLSEETLRNRAYRMLCFCKEYFEKHPVGKKLEYNREEAEFCAKEMAQKAVKISRDRMGLLPLKRSPETRIAHVVLNSVWTDDLHRAEEITAKLAQYVNTVDCFPDPGGDKLCEIAKSGEYDYIICSVLEDGAYGMNVAKLCGPAARNMMCGWMRFNTPVVFIGYNNPYFGETYAHSVDTIINTFGFTKYTADGVIQKLFGE